MSKDEFPNILTLDVEEWFQVQNLADSIPKVSWHRLPSRVEVGLNLFLDILDEYDVKATFFILGWIVLRFPQVVGKIVKRGHEAACHGWEHEMISRMNAGSFRDETDAAATAIADIAGKPVMGYRAPTFSINKDNLWAFEILGELGFKYDSSVYPIRRERYGMPGFPRYPVRLDLPSGADLVEFPLPTMRLPGMNLPVGGGGYLRFWPYAMTKKAVELLNFSGVPAVVYLHPWELDPDQPRILQGSQIKRWMHYHNLSQTETNLRNLLIDFKFTTMEEAYRNSYEKMEFYRPEGDSWLSSTDSIK